MTPDTWTLDASTGGRLTIETDVAGKAAKMGHRLTIVVGSWTAMVKRSAGTPTAVTLTADLNSLDVVSGEGGLTPLVGPEKIVAKANALKTLDAKRHPRVHFVSTAVAETDQGFLVTGELEIHGVTRTVDVQVEADGRTLSSRATVRQSEFGITPYSQMFGAMKVVDEVVVSLQVDYPADGGGSR